MYTTDVISPWYAAVAGGTKGSMDRAALPDLWVEKLILSGIAGSHRISPRKGTVPVACFLGTAWALAKVLGVGETVDVILVIVTPTFSPPSQLLQIELLQKY